MIKRRIISGLIILATVVGWITFAENFDASLYDSLQWEAQWATIRERIETNTYQISWGGGTFWEQIRDFLLYLWSEVFIPIIIIVGVLFAMIGFYKIMVSDTEEETKKWSQFLLRWVIWILIMVSASFIANTLVGIEEWTPFQWWTDSIAWVISSGAWWGEIARAMYEDLIYPFLWLAFDLIIWVLFIFVLIEAFKYLTATDDSSWKKAFTLLLYSVIWTIIVIVSKALVELIYWRYSDVIAWWANSLEDIGTWVLDQWSQWLTLFYTVINWVLGLAAFLVLIILIVQWYQLLINPNDEELLKTIQKNLGYIFLGIMIVWSAYLIVNFFLITY
jgi:hypothetical protein